MSPIGLAKYIFFSALLVGSLFLSLRLLFASEMHREAWRSNWKHRIYISRERFKLLNILLGWILLFLALYIAYNQLDAIIANQE